MSGRDSVVLLRALLTPVSWVYSWAAARRITTTIPRHAPVPVICVGNFTVGGAGKTPITRALRAKLGDTTHTLSRGYGGNLPGPLRVTPEMSAQEVGDEPLLHAADGPAWIARDRVAGALAAANNGAHAIIMDDGFQNPTLGKDLSIIVVDPAFGIGNGKVFPAGPLRERLRDGLQRANAIVMLDALGGDDGAAESEWLKDFTKPIFHARLEAVAPPPGKYVAFAGLARPEKFFDTLTALAAELEDMVPYPDHHPYSDDNLEFLTRLAAERGATLITTEKDAARLTPEWRARVTVLPVTARFEDEAALDALLAPIRARM
ncbi:MAG: tetraacyldisaccharide 4'-kinase [Vitreimonas sp.]